MQNFNPKVNLMGQIQNTMPTGFGVKNMSPTQLDSIDTANKNSFKDVMSGLSNNLNNQVNAPNELLRKSMTGSSDVDIHDVMVAMSKAEISVSVATQITSKVIQAYDKIMQISV